MNVAASIGLASTPVIVAERKPSIGPLAAQGWESDAPATMPLALVL
jgi:hypothetical protein